MYLQNMIENQAKEELIEMKAEPEQGGKTYRKSSRVRLGVGNSRLSVEVRLGVEMDLLCKPVISMKTLEDSSWVCLGVKSKLYMQIYDTVIIGILSNPRKRLQKLVKTKYNLYTHKNDCFVIELI